MFCFVVEVGCNTSQEGDGAGGGEKKIIGRGTAAEVSAAVNVSHFTVLGFTAVTGEPVMCGIVVQGETVRSDVVTGIDPFVKKIGSEDDSDFIANNTGKGKLYPIGPTCTFKGVEVPYMVACTTNGSITSDILVQFFKKWMSWSFSLKGKDSSLFYCCMDMVQGWSFHSLSM